MDFVEVERSKSSARSSAELPLWLSVPLGLPGPQGREGGWWAHPRPSQECEALDCLHHDRGQQWPPGPGPGLKEGPSCSSGIPVWPLLSRAPRI